MSDMSELTKKLIGTPEVLDEKTKVMGDFDKWINTLQKNAEVNFVCVKTLMQLAAMLRMGILLDKEESIKGSIEIQMQVQPQIPIEKNYKDLQVLLSPQMMNAKVEVMTLYASSVMAHTSEQILMVAYILKWIHMNLEDTREVMPLDILKSFPRGIPTYNDLDRAWKVSQHIVNFKRVVEHL